MAWRVPGVRSGRIRVVPAATAPGFGVQERSVIHRDEDVVAADLDGVDVDRLDRGQAECLAGPDIESGAVPRAPDLRALERPLGERAAIMGADVVDRVVGPIDVEDRDRPSIDLDPLLAARGYLAPDGDFHEFRHGDIIRLERWGG